MMKNLTLRILSLILLASVALAAEEVAVGAVTDEATTVLAAPAVAVAVADPAVTAAAIATKAESEIPLTVDMTKKMGDATPTSTRLFMTAFILISILGATYYLVRKYKLSNNINKSNKQIKIISQHYLGPKKSLAIIHVAGESMLIGVTDHNISMIKSLSLIDDEVPAHLPQNFSDTLQTKLQPAAGASAHPEELEEEFSFAGVKDSVSKKLKSMRSLS